MNIIVIDIIVFVCYYHHQYCHHWFISENMSFIVTFYYHYQYFIIEHDSFLSIGVFVYRFLLLMKTHGIFFTPWSLESWPAFSKRHPHPAFFSREVVVGPRKWPEKDHGFFFPNWAAGKKKVPQPLRRYLGWRAFLFSPVLKNEPWKNGGASSKVWVPMSPGWDFWFITCGSHWIGIPKWSFESVPLEDSDWLLNLFLEKSKVPWPTIGCMKLEKPLRKSPKI